MKLVPGSQQQFMQVSPEYVLKLKKLEKFIDPLTKLIEMKQHNERSGSASPTGETECTMNSLRSIVKGEEIVEYNVLTRVERLLEERFEKDTKLPDPPVDHWKRNGKVIIEKSDQPLDHSISFAKKPVRDLTEMEMSQIRGEVVSLINYYASIEDKIKDLTTLLHLLNKSPHRELEH